MKEQTFIIDGDEVTYVGIDIIDQDHAEKWYRMYSSGGHCPFSVKVATEEPYKREIGKGAFTFPIGEEPTYKVPKEEPEFSDADVDYKGLQGTLKQHAPGVWEIGKGIMTGDAGAEMYAETIKREFKTSDGWSRAKFDAIKRYGSMLGDLDIALENNYKESGVYIEHLEETERESVEDYIEYCQYAQKLQTELSEGSIFIQDEMNSIGLELAGIEESRMDLNAKEVDLERQMSYLKTVQSLINKRKSDLNKEHGEVAAKRGSSESETTGRVEMDKEHNNNQDG